METLHCMLDLNFLVERGTVPEFGMCLQLNSESCVYPVLIAMQTSVLSLHNSI